MTTHDKTYKHKRTFTANELPELLRILEQDRARGIRYRVRGRYSYETREKIADEYYTKLRRFLANSLKKGIDYREKSFGCGCNPTMYEAFFKKYPNIATPVDSSYNDITLIRAKKRAQSKYPVEFYDLYVY